MCSQHGYICSLIENMRSLATELLGSSRAGVLAALLLRPDEALHVRELARITGISPGTLHRELQALTNLGLLSRRQTGRQVFYAADTNSPVFEDLAGFLRKTAGLVQPLRDALLPLGTQIHLAFVFGSMAAGKAQSHSDVDVMVLGDAPFAEVVRVLHPARATLGREVNPVVMGAAEFVRKQRERDGFVASVAREPKLWLIGDENDFAKLGEDRPAKAARSHARRRAATVSGRSTKSRRRRATRQ
jgi:predicted nucleotidyltransferase